MSLQFQWVQRVQWVGDGWCKWSAIPCHLSIFPRHVFFYMLSSRRFHVTCLSCHFLFFHVTFFSTSQNHKQHGFLAEGGDWPPKKTCFSNGPRVWAPRFAVIKLSCHWFGTAVLSLRTANVGAHAQFVVVWTLPYTTASSQQVTYQIAQFWFAWSPCNKQTSLQKKWSETVEQLVVNLCSFPVESHPVRVWVASLRFNHCQIASWIT